MTVLYCGCTQNSAGSTQGANFQDKAYGKGMRVVTGSGVVSVGKQRCTVCGKEIQKQK